MKKSKHTKNNGIIDIEKGKTNSNAIKEKTNIVDNLCASAEFTNVD